MSGLQGNGVASSFEALINAGRLRACRTQLLASLTHILRPQEKEEPRACSVPARKRSPIKCTRCNIYPQSWHRWQSRKPRRCPQESSASRTETQYQWPVDPRPSQGAEYQAHGINVAHRAWREARQCSTTRRSRQRRQSPIQYSQCIFSPA